MSSDGRRADAIERLFDAEGGRLQSSANDRLKRRCAHYSQRPGDSGHLKAESPIVHIRADQVERDWPYQTVFDFNAIVSDKGEVVHADFIPGTLGEPHLQVVKQAEERIRKYQFVPFVRDGQPVFARLTIGVRILPPEKLPDEHVLFPELKDRKTMVITLSRFRCLGYCPEYRIQIFGDGKVEYVGQCAVEVVGRHSSHISRKEVDGLFAQFRQTDYFSLDDSPRRSLAAILKQELKLIAIPPGSGSSKRDMTNNHFGDIMWHFLRAVSKDSVTLPIIDSP